MKPDFVLEEIKRLNEQITEVGRDIDHIRNYDLPAVRVDIGKLQVKSGLWGAGAAVITVLAAVLMRIL